MRSDLYLSLSRINLYCCFVSVKISDKLPSIRNLSLIIDSCISK